MIDPRDIEERAEFLWREDGSPEGRQQAYFELAEALALQEHHFEENRREKELARFAEAKWAAEALAS